MPALATRTPPRGVTKKVTGTPWAFATTVSSSMNLYAHWTQAYTVSFDAGGGSAVVDESVVPGGSVASSPSTSRTGYTFAGWWDASGNRVTFPLTVGADLALTAHWTPVSYAVTFKNNDGTAAASVVNADFGSMVDLSGAPSRTGYDFAGWYDDATAGSRVTASVTVAGDTTLFAHWTKHAYAVTFDLNGAPGAAPTSPDVAYDTQVAAPVDPTRSGYTFLGWTTTSDGAGAPWDFNADTIGAGPLTLYAQWTDLSTYTVSFDAGGGSAVVDESVVPGGSVASSPSTSRTGYTFAGWWDASGNRVTFPLTVGADLALTAHWTPVSYAVTFKNNDGTAAASVVNADFGSMVDLPGAPSRTGYDFAGWYDDATAGSRVTTSVTVAGDTTLFAHWTKHAYAVTFDTNGRGATTPSTANPVYGDTLSAPTATWTGHHVTGWNTASDGTGSTWHFGTDTVTTDLTLYAQWALDTYAVTFDSGGGSSVPDQAVAYGALATQPGSPARTGYSFDGWYAGSTAYLWNVPVDGPITLTAHWRAIPSGGQNIVFLPPSVLLSGAGGVPLTATSSAGLPVSFAVASGSCSMSGGTTLLAPSDTTCTVVASQPGDTGWLAATPVTRTIRFVSPVGDTATAGSPAAGPKPVDVAVLANDPAGLALAGTGSPQHGAATARKATVGYTPEKTYRGTDTFSYQVGDVLGRTAEATVVVTVPDAPPTVTGATLAQLQGTTRSVTLTTADPNGDPVTLTAKGPGAVGATINGRTVSISPDDTASGWVTIQIVADDGAGGVGTSTLRSLVQPRAVSSAVRRLQDDGTLVSWPASPTKDARYRVFVDGEAVCTTSGVQCVVGKVLGPDFTVQVQVLGLDGTTSERTTAAARGHRQVLLRTVYFDPGKWTLGNAQFQKLVTVGELIRRLGFHDAHVSGYTDSDGGAQYNLDLSKQRTRLVAKQLMSARQVSSEQAWFGYNQPAASNATDKGKSLNRRVEILVSY